MKRIFLLLILIIVITGCSKKNSYIDTIIVENSNQYITINYPVTNTNLDLIIKNDIDKIYNESLNNKYTELNIDYLLYEKKQDISVTLFIYYQNQFQNYKYVKTYYYRNKILEINDIIDRKLLNKVLIGKIKEYNLPTNSIYNDFEFSIDEKNITIYFQNEFNYTEIVIPLSMLNIETEEETTVLSDIIIPEIEIDPNEKVIALTFDDGPSIYTEQIVEYLYSQGCRATFFVLGNKVKNYSDVLKKSIGYGMEIGNHSYNHKWLIKLKKEEMIEQIEKTQEIIKTTTGYVPKLLRPTYGSVSDTLKESTNLDIVLWNVDTLDWKTKNVSRIVKRATSKLKDGNIILMHDIYKRTLNAVKKIVPILKEEGYTCVTVSELNEINNLRSGYN